MVIATHCQPRATWQAAVPGPTCTQLMGAKQSRRILPSKYQGSFIWSLIAASEHRGAKRQRAIIIAPSPSGSSVLQDTYSFKGKKNTTEFVPEKDLLADKLGKDLKIMFLKMLKELKEDVEKVKETMWEQNASIN